MIFYAAVVWVRRCLPPGVAAAGGVRPGGGPRYVVFAGDVGSNDSLADVVDRWEAA